MKLAIIIPAHNEERRIAKTLEEYGKFFSEMKKEGRLDSEIIIVLNACKDNTLAVVKKYEKKYGIMRHLDFKEGGKGFAIIKGFKEALKKNFDLIGFVDADNATNAEAYYDLIENIRENDGIIASRYIRGAKVNPKQSTQRIIVSRIFNFLVRAFFLMPHRDTQCGAKLFKSGAIKKIIDKIGTTRWAFDVDLLYQMKKNNFKIKEDPTVWSDKEYSKINLKSAGPSMFLAIVRLRLLNSPIRGVVDLYNRLKTG